MRRVSRPIKVSRRLRAISMGPILYGRRPNQGGATVTKFTTLTSKTRYSPRQPNFPCHLPKPRATLPPTFRANSLEYGTAPLQRSLRTSLPSCPTDPRFSARGEPRYSPPVWTPRPLTSASPRSSFPRLQAHPERPSCLPSRSSRDKQSQEVQLFERDGRNRGSQGRVQ